MSYYNRGTVQPGQDHAYFHLRPSGSYGHACIHPGSKGNFPVALKVTYINWWGRMR
ncbi:hypothetical protein [Nonomuraea zeae]|uniref:hypothetical protein n=1 Tax=Nonomuraea zeae TaxID=1642303 RepID=UPI0014786FC1|nr:hypothetical protein [Nonomuraea zeae]